MAAHDYPLMIYHVVEGHKTVYSDEERDTLIKHGWSLDHHVFSDYEATKAKLSYHESEAARLREVLIDMLEKSDPKTDKEGDNPGAKNGPSNGKPEGQAVPLLLHKKRGRPASKKE